MVTRSSLSAAFYEIEEFYRRLYWKAPGAKTVATEHYTLSYSGTSWLHSVNQLWLHNEADQLYTRCLADWLDSAEIFFREYGADYNVVFSQTERSPITDQLLELGYLERMRSPILMLEGLPRIHNHAQGTRIVRVTETEKHDLIQVLQDTFYLGPELIRCIVQPELLADPRTRHYVAYIGPEAASCATVLLGEDHIAGIWNVGTVRPFRRRGLASSVLALALFEAAAEGCTSSVLLASQMGRPLYEAMGYQCIGETIYFSPSDLVGL